MLKMSRRLSISKKITLIYSSILLSIIVVFTIVTLISVNNLIIKNNEDILSSEADLLANYIENIEVLTLENIAAYNLGDGIHYTIYDEQKNIIFSDIDKRISTKSHNDFSDRKNDDFERNDGTLSILKKVNINKEIYYIVLTKDFEDIGKRTNDIIGLLISISIWGLIISLLSGFFLSKKLLSPIKAITNTAKEITSKNLNTRIPVGDNNDELTDLAETFNSMIERLETDFERQKRFVSDASHELRTPLAVMHGHVNMLNRWGKNDTTQLEKSLLTLKKETDNMNRLVEDLLLLAKGDNDVFPLKQAPINVSSLFEEIIEETHCTYSDLNISFSCEGELTVNADYDKLKQVLRILIDNSIKFNNEKVAIKLLAEKAKKSEKSQETIQLSVVDNGIGIPYESLPKIFDRFYRVDESRTKISGGTGLGLSIAKQIIEYHHGKIWAESSPEHGTKIIITL